MALRSGRWIGILAFSALYPFFSYFVDKLPNPMIPGAILALNMVFPVLAGYFYGPYSGAIAGALGTAVAALLRADVFDALAVFPHLAMGYAAGLAGNRRSEIWGALSILIGHTLNIIFFTRLRLVVFPPGRFWNVLLGLVTESTINIVIILLVIAVLGRRLYLSKRW